MATLFILINVVFVVLPLTGVILSNIVSLDKVVPYVRYITAFFVVHNVCYVIGYSVKGDVFDYLVFALEYPFFSLCMILWIDVRKNIYTKILSTLGYLVAFVGIVIAVFSLFFLPLERSAYLADKRIYLNGEIHAYQVRRYSFGSASAEDLYYTFETYRVYKYFPFEHLKNSSTVFATEGDVSIGDDLHVAVNSKAGIDSLLISSHGKTFLTIKIDL